MAWAYAWPRVALSLGGGADFTGRSLPGSEEQLTGGYGRASLEGRIPVGPFVLRAGGGARAGVVAQIVEPRAIRGFAPPSTSRTAFALGPELFIVARVGLGRSQRVFADLGAMGSVLFLDEEGSLSGIAGVVGGASIGTRS